MSVYVCMHAEVLFSGLCAVMLTLCCIMPWAYQLFLY